MAIAVVPRELDVSMALASAPAALVPVFGCGEFNGQARENRREYVKVTRGGCSAVE
jgi:hypothetical protein